MPFVLTRQQFYDVLWSAPMKQLRPVFGVSDVMIGRIARSGQVPLPGIGYWRKVETGAKLPREKLSLPDLLTREAYGFPGVLTPEVTAMFDGEPGKGDPEEDVDVLAVRLRNRIGQVRVSSADRDFHPDIKKMQQRDMKRGWGDPTYTGYLGGRALAVVSALFLKVEDLGCRPSVRADYSEFSFDLGIGLVGPLKVHMDRQNLRLSIGPADSRISDGLGLQTYSDTEITPIEKRLHEVLLAYATQGERTRRRWRDEDIERQRKEAERRRLDLERQERESEKAFARKQQQDKQDLVAAAIAEAGRWRDAELVRQYADAYQAKHKGDGVALAHHEWLLSVANQIDPLTPEGDH